MFELFKVMLLMLWPPYFFRVARSVFGPRSPGWGGAIEALMAPIWFILGLCVIAVWISLLWGAFYLVQFLMQHLNWS
jgi:hypothetical protein